MNLLLAAALALVFAGCQSGVAPTPERVLVTPDPSTLPTPVVIYVTPPPTPGATTVATLTPTASPRPTSVAIATAAPALATFLIVEPANGETVSAADIVVRGTAPSGARLVRDISFAPDDSTIADDGGMWAIPVKLDTGSNDLTFRIGDDKTTAIRLRITYRSAVAIAATPAPSTKPVVGPSATPKATPKPTPKPKPTAKPANLVFGALNYKENICWESDAAVDRQGHEFSGAIATYSIQVRNTGGRTSERVWFQVDWLNGLTFVRSELFKMSGGNLGSGTYNRIDNSIWMRGPALKAGERKTLTFKVFYEELSRVEFKISAMNGGNDFSSVDLFDPIYESGELYHTVDFCF